jgi:hypothetical protein
MTPEQQQALFTIQKSFTPEILEHLDELAAMLKGTPQDDVERICNNIGHIYLTTLQHVSPEMEESLQYGIVFGFSELLKTRLKAAN